MTYKELLTEITRRPCDEQLSLLDVLARTTVEEIRPVNPWGQIVRVWRLPAPDLELPDDPALAALEAQFE
jgi:hypothetical protein